MRAETLVAAAAIVLIAGCGDNLSPELTLLDDPLAPLPPTVAELGLYPDLADLSTVSDQVTTYRPAQELWSNGSVKDRHVAVPAPIDVSDRARWAFPAGTLLFKTFRFEDDRPVETRVLRLGDDARWEYASYRWRDDASDGDLLDLAEPVPVAVTVGDVDFDHLIPSRLDCRTCHESSAQPVLGFDELGLGAAQLDDLVAAGVIAGALPDPLDQIGGATELEREVLGYLEGNCTHCHNGGDAPSSNFDMRHPVAVDALRCRPTAGQTSPGLRVVPGDPAASMLFLAVSGETDDPDVKAMPPLGVQHRDPDGIELLRAWIASLEGTCDP